MRSPLARDRRSPSGFIRPYQAILADAPPSGPQWLHEIKHDGFWIVAHKQGDRVRLWSRNGRNWSAEFVAIRATVREFSGDVILDGEAVAHCDRGLPDFNALVGRHGCASAMRVLSGIGRPRRPTARRSLSLQRLAAEETLSVVSASRLSRRAHSDIGRLRRVARSGNGA